MRKLRKRLMESEELSLKMDVEKTSDFIKFETDGVKTWYRDCVSLEIKRPTYLQAR